MVLRWYQYKVICWDQYSEIIIFRHTHTHSRDQVWIMMEVQRRKTQQIQLQIYLRLSHDWPINKNKKKQSEMQPACLCGTLVGKWVTWVSSKHEVKLCLFPQVPHTNFGWQPTAWRHFYTVIHHLTERSSKIKHFSASRGRCVHFHTMWQTFTVNPTTVSFCITDKNTSTRTSFAATEVK